MRLRQKQLDSCFCGTMVAFEIGEFHRVKGGGNWIPASVAQWLPLILVSFIGKKAEATGFLLLWYGGCLCLWRVSSSQSQRQLNSCFCGTVVAFGLGELHRVRGGGNWIPAFED